MVLNFLNLKLMAIYTNKKKLVNAKADTSSIFFKNKLTTR